MWGFMLKDFYVYKKEALVYLGLALLCSIYFFIPHSQERLDYFDFMYPLGKVVFIAFIFLSIGEIETALLAKDERTCYRQFALSSPQCCKGQVLSKYYDCLLLTLLGAFWCVFLLFVSNLVTNSVSRLEHYVVFFAIFQLFLRALELPFLFRFGTRYGIYYKMGIWLGIAITLLTYGLYGDISKIISHIQSQDSLLHWLISLMSETQQDTSFIFAGILSVAVLLLFYGSYHLSCRCYRKVTQDMFL